MAKTHEDRFLTVAQAAELAGVSTATVRRWIRNGLLDKYKIGGLQHVRVLDTQVQAMTKPIKVIQNR